MFQENLQSTCVGNQSCLEGPMFHESLQKVVGGKMNICLNY